MFSASSVLWLRLVQTGKSCSLILHLKGEFWTQYKLGSNERAWKIQKNKPSLTFMCQLFPGISQFEVIFPPDKDATIFMILSLIPRGKVWCHSHTTKNWEKRKCNTRISLKCICLKFCKFIEFLSTIQFVFKICCHGNWNENNGVLLKRQKPIVYTNVLTIFQLESTQIIS